VYATNTSPLLTDFFLALAYNCGCKVGHYLRLGRTTRVT